MNGFSRIILLLPLLPIAVSGCGMTRATERPPAPIAIVQPTPPETLTPKKGSIWQTTDRNTLFLDNKARNVGDVITVKIVENATANKDATTELKRNNTNGMSLGGALDLTTLLKSNTPLNSATANSTNDFKGEGNTTRKSDFKATVSCIVTQVLANGNLRIEGRRDITLNHENQFIMLSGVIRPEDIDASNSVTSAQIADARIEFSGEGDIDDQQRPSWIGRFFSTVNIL
ncbi:MAG: flagellar basal body L-ring protein FlgH [Magnetococcales bacterium]|nr:flagellar basal body L-ring protein FlgH [Magnetococcales bacterium]MBF0438488.1 flagellar basal body L-ring protein FlgH [Magnetococcales bacterium]